MRLKSQHHKQIAPRLADGGWRERMYSALPAAAKESVRAIARHENKSMSWVIEEIVYDVFKLRRPWFVTRSKKARRGRNG
jgi:hypothetical protein